MRNVHDWVLFLLRLKKKRNIFDCGVFFIQCFLDFKHFDENFLYHLKDCFSELKLKKYILSVINFRKAMGV